jgi:hypothetical protein
MLPKKAIERMMRDVALKQFSARVAENGSGVVTPEVKMEESVKIEEDVDVVVDRERNEALERERPGDAVFRAIFGSDDEDD